MGIKDPTGKVTQMVVDQYYSETLKLVLEANDKLRVSFMLYAMAYNLDEDVPVVLQEVLAYNKALCDQMVSKATPTPTAVVDKDSLN